MISSEKELLINDVQRRLCEESIPRILKCLELLDDQQIWFRENENSNAIGNLVLHLNGNIRQWIFSGLLGTKDIRNRNAEFTQKTIIPKKEVQRILIHLNQEFQEKFNLLKDVDLVQEHAIQGIQENGVSILMHVVEHFSYHTGQIALLTKKLKNTDLGFYRDNHLNDLNS